MIVLPVKVVVLYATFLASIPLALRAEIYNQTTQLNETRQQYLDFATSIVYGSDDNIYVAGYNWNPITYGDWYVISLDTTGNSNWVYCYNGPTNWQDMGYSIVYGGDSNIYSAGYSTHSPENWDFTVISLTTAGNTNWIYQYDGNPGIEENVYSQHATERYFLSLFIHSHVLALQRWYSTYQIQNILHHSTYMMPLEGNRT